MPTHLSDTPRGAPGGDYAMIHSKKSIERAATDAAAAGRTIDDACPYPFGSPAADHFKAVYLLALPLASDIRARNTPRGCAQPRPGCGGQCHGGKPSACKPTTEAHA